MSEIFWTLERGVVDAETYRRFVQEVQAACMPYDIRTRVLPVYSNVPRYLGRGAWDQGYVDPKRNPRLSQSRFEVFYGDWKLLGTETPPMSPECRRTIYPETWRETMFQIAGDISK